MALHCRSAKQPVTVDLGSSEALEQQQQHGQGELVLHVTIQSAVWHVIQVVPHAPQRP